MGDPWQWDAMARAAVETHDRSSSRDAVVGVICGSSVVVVIFVFVLVWFCFWVSGLLRNLVSNGHRRKGLVCQGCRVLGLRHGNRTGHPCPSPPYSQHEGKWCSPLWSVGGGRF